MHNTQRYALARAHIHPHTFFETIFSLIRTMADEQTQLKSENAELKTLMTELKCSIENHHKQRQKGNTTITKLQDTMSQKDKDNGDLTRTITEL